MRKLFAMFVSLLAMAGCTVEEGDDGGRTLGVYRIFCSADDVMRKVHLRAMDVARLTEEYIGASESERPAIWEKVPFYFYMTEVEENHWQLVGRPQPEDELWVWHLYTDGKSLYEAGSRWTIAFSRYTDGAEDEWTAGRATIESLGDCTWSYVMEPSATGPAYGAELSVALQSEAQERGHVRYEVSGTGTTQLRSGGGWLEQPRTVKVDYRADRAEYTFCNLQPGISLGGGYDLTLSGDGFPQPVEMSVSFLMGGTTVTVGEVSEYYGDVMCDVLR